MDVGLWSTFTRQRRSQKPEVVRGGTASGPWVRCVVPIVDAGKRWLKKSYSENWTMAVHTDVAVGLQVVEDPGRSDHASGS